MVMARELSLNEMKRIREETGMELEAFVHGALCYCYSGQCLFSSMLEEEAETAADVHSHAGFLTQCWMKSTGNTKRCLCLKPQGYVWNKGSAWAGRCRSLFLEN